jgi:formylglycine-generating enzyme required for sulfatase activity
MGEGTISMSGATSPGAAPDAHSEGTIAMGPPTSTGADPQAEGTMAMPAPGPSGAGGDPQVEGTVAMGASSELSGAATLGGDAGEGLSNAPTSGTPTPAPARAPGHDDVTRRDSTGGIRFEETGGAATSEVTPATLPSLRTIAQRPLPPGGIKIGKYHLKRELGRGGMGVVYQATDMGLGREVALKLMLSQDVPEDEKERFVREAEASASLKHPYIVTLLEASVEGGVFYFSMDYIEGKTFKAVIQERSTDLPLLLGIFAKTCEGIGYAHRKGIIHRDLKPQNVMVDTEMNPHVMDFGLARRLDDAEAAAREKARKAEETKKKARLTQMGALMGTPVYMPPEQAAGKVDEVDTRSDIYSLGVILYSILTGDLPFRAKSTPELLLMIEEQAPPPPRSKNPACPWELEAVALRAIAKKKDDRYQTCFELKEDIEAWLGGLPVSAAGRGALYRARKFVRRNRGLVAGAAALVLATGGVVGWQVQERRAEVRRRQEQVQALIHDGSEQAARAKAKLEALAAARSSLSAEERLARLREADALYGKGDELVARALGLDERSQAATQAQGAIRMGRREVRALEESEAREEERKKAEVAELENRRRKARESAVGATERARAVDADGAARKEEVDAARAAVEAESKALLGALGLDSDSKEALAGLEVVRAKLMRLDETERNFQRRERVDALEAEADKAIAEARAAEAAKDAEGAWTRYRAAAQPLAEAVRLDDRVAALRTKRVDVALELGRLALAQRRPELAELVVDEVVGLDRPRVEAFLGEVRKAKEDGQKFAEAMKRADIARENEQWKEAAAAYALALQAAEARPEAEFGLRFARGSAEAREGRHKEALSIFEEAGPFADAGRASDRGALDRAMRRSRGALAAAAVQEAEAALRRGRLDEALAQLRTARGLDPENADAVRLEGEVEARRRVPPGTVLVAAGTFTSGVGAEAREGVEVAQFFIGKTEVTNRDYHEFVKDRGYERKELWDAAGWEARAELTGRDGRAGPAGWLSGRPPEARERFPVTGISWYEARAYSAWKGFRLPTDVEWEKAASWDAARGRKVDPPWITRAKDGAVASAWTGLWRPYFNRSEPKVVSGEVARNASGAPVFDRSPYDADDVWGNAREWVVVPGAGGVESPGARGGSYASRIEDRSTVYRLFRPSPLYRALDIGFRVARSTAQ